MTAKDNAKGLITINQDGARDMTNEQEEDDEPYAIEISCSHCDTNMGYLVLNKEEDKSDRLIDILNEHEMTTICIQCSIESEINKMTSKI